MPGNVTWQSCSNPHNIALLLGSPHLSEVKTDAQKLSPSAGLFGPNHCTPSSPSPFHLQPLPPRISLCKIRSSWEREALSLGENLSLGLQIHEPLIWERIWEDVIQSHLLQMKRLSPVPYMSRESQVVVFFWATGSPNHLTLPRRQVQPEIHPMPYSPSWESFSNSPKSILGPDRGPVPANSGTPVP